MNGQRLPSWDTLKVAVPTMTLTMRRYLEQIDCVLRPASVVSTDAALRMFASFIAGSHPNVTSVAGLQRAHLEDYKRWLAAAPTAARHP